MGDLNEKDRLEYKHALETLRRDDISDEERQAAEAAMDEIEQRRKEQMDAMVSAALEGIEGVSNVTTKAGIGVYTSTNGEVVEYTFEVEAEVEAGAEEAYRAAMASIAEVTRQDSFIVNYPDETPENATGEHDSAAQVRVKLDRPLSRTEQAQLTDMFSSLKLGLTITTDEISTSNFSNYSDENFDTLARYLLEGFNNGDAKTTIQNARRVAETGNFRELEETQGVLDSARGHIWSGAVESRTNYSTYYEAKGREFFIKKKGENERKDKGIRKDYADLKGKPAYHTEDKGNIPSTTVTPETIKGRVASAYNKSEDKKALSADFVLSAQPISDGYTTLQQEVEDIIDQAIADYESDTGKQWQGDRNELLERAAVFVRGMFLAADKRIGSKDKSGETRWNGIQTYVDEKLAEVENNQVVWDVLSEINARAEEKFVSMSKAARTEAAREFTTEIPERRRHMVASPVQAFAVQEENDKQREGGKKNSEEGLRDRIAKRKERDAEKKKKKEEEREKKEEERKKKAEEKAAKKAEEDAKQANERDRLAQALLDKHGSIAEYLKNTAIPDFTYKGKPITLFEYLTSTGKERKLINEEYSRQHTITQLGAETTLEESADLATTVKQMLNEGANQVIYSKRIQIESGGGKKTTAISPKTSAKTLEAILAAEQEAKTTQHIKDGMAELGLELAEEKTQEPIDETNEATDETKLTEEPVDEEVVEEQPKPTKRGQEKQEAADEEELDDYERERENERADDEADEAFLRQQEAEFENQLGGKDKGQSRQSDEALRNDPEAVRQRIEFLEEKVDYEMATPEEEAELADLRQRLADMQSDPRFSIGSENRTAATPAQSAATQAVLDMLEKAGIEVEQVSDEEARQELAKQSNAELMAVTEQFNDTLNRYTDENADNIKFNCGMPSEALLLAGMPNVGIRLNGEVLRKKMKAHQFAKEDVRNLPLYMQNPIAVFNGSHDNTFAVLTEMLINGRNTLVAIDIKGAEIQDFVEVSSLYDKNRTSVINWINDGKLLSVDKEKALRYIDTDAPIAPTGNNKGANSAAKIVQDFDTAKSFVGKNADTPQFSVRTTPAPKKTGIGYKVFYRGKDGKLYPPMVANPNGADTPVGVWLNADAAPITGESKTGRPQVKAGGKGTQGGSGQLAYRPGWHLGEIPYALQFNRKDADGNRTLFPKDFVWAEVEYAADNNYQQEAEQEGYTDNGKYRHSYAGLKHLPTDGFYRYRTNPNPETDPWIITGAMKVNRVLSNEEVDEIVRRAGRQPQKREFLQTSDGTIYGYAKGGKIYLTARGLNPNTPIHEYTHLWDTACQRANPELWKRGVELMKQLPLWEAIFIVFLQMHCNFSR